MASYNHEEFVRAAIESVLNQSFEDFEFLITDDGSTDGTRNEIRKIKDPRISFVEFPGNRGACVAMNASIERSSGRYVAVLNSDDVFLPGKLAKQVEYLEAHPDVGGTFAYPQFIDASGRRLADEQTFCGRIFCVENKSREQWLRHFFLYGNALCHPSAMIRRRCYEKVGLYNPALAQLPDFEMWIRMFSHFSFHVFSERLVGFRILEGGRNASAPRPAVAVRLEWECRKALDHYLALTEGTLRKVFPELPGRGRAWMPRWVVSAAGRILGRYLHQGEKSNGAAEDRPLGFDQGPGAQNWALARLALQVGRPAHVLFALDLMYATMRTGSAHTMARELIQQTGAFDPFGMLFGLPPNRSLDLILRGKR